ncbi:hypothetical protein IY145_23535 [Methylosinus sp. H3A]|uniref:hypothetical protein n=2 Tax=Methylosinus sp. H3A TaxID=2785786 RepID=UPI0018C1F46D|nr:hypothetical protein [Methylosinus sp. H3A]MBG0812322.1 hypothetical protein [Methylosinus sp. H3A]
MDDAKIIDIGLKALRLHIARLEDEGTQHVNLAAAIELQDQFAISGMNAEDFQLFALADLLAKIATWPQSRLAGLARASLTEAAERCRKQALALIDA